MKWVPIFQEYDYDVTYCIGINNKNVNGLNWTPSFNELNTTKGMLFHSFTFQQMVAKKYHVKFKLIFQALLDNSNVELDDIGFMDIFGDVQVLTQLQIGGLVVGLTFIEKDWVLQRVKGYCWKRQ